MVLKNGDRSSEADARNAQGTSADATPAPDGPAGALWRKLIWIDFTMQRRFDLLLGYRFLRVDDSVTIGTTKRVFNGEFNDPKKKPDPKKPSLEEYAKAFSDADAKYTSLVTMVLDGLKKVQ